jgi:hypothetical protein
MNTIQIGPFTVQWDPIHGELIMIGMDCQPVLSSEDAQALLGYLYDLKDDIYRATHALEISIQGPGETSKPEDTASI